ncbi:hypothetical protein GCM10007981_08340 [Thermocladium modestius]|uniref:Uncharacterized protein n=1 Tax=Thermocladium modestius TaxID=62609 RepID=A0A830GUT2_9CREN|nr:hypothetical protein [Thermocladium modestius]GGP20404.1 hypothetical protein GCM10007981_08340 [Thermocladium modestius]
MSAEDRIYLEELLGRLDAVNNIEVIGYDQDGAARVTKVKGIIKGELNEKELGELKKRRPRGKPTPKQVKTVKDLASILYNNKVKFKVVFGSKEATIRFDQGYIRLTEEDARIAGFKSENDFPLPLIKDELNKYGKVLFLKPLK